ncbi:c1A receptor, putative [Caerostris darwini]|uniref:C1A receptor, putative n=1 Tax=Caerostris darwini TaxID=1538125 RepID=A0AAV4N8V4_9ARAC|nr:c1A receptor, putative [Caerostris darwini]
MLRNACQTGHIPRIVIDLGYRNNHVGVAFVASTVGLRQRFEKDCGRESCIDSWIDPFCAAAWDSFICWPPLSPGEMMSKPCPQMDTKGTIIGDAKHPDMFAVRTCAENGSWVENRTNFSLCITNMAVRICTLL